LSQRSEKDSGRPIFYIPLKCSIIVSRKEILLYIICAGLLHDVVEDANISLDEINARFGPRVAKLLI
jgi:GTP pyrophosphokinase